MKNQLTKENRMAHNFNQYYFDVIDNEHKAYWLGFIWSDGYLGYRIRDNGREEYNLKLSLMEADYKHLEKFNNDIDGNYKVHYYSHGKSSFKSNTGKESRLFIANKHLGKTLRNEYGIIPHRESCEKIIKCLPEHLVRHFIRGVIDADGSFCHYNITEGNYIVNKYSIKICGTISMLRFIEEHLVGIGLIKDVNRKLSQRHAGDGHDKGCRSLSLSGKNNVVGVLNHIYRNASVYLDRKYEKYLKILEGLD
jgi:hypothetical protein